MLSGNLNSAFVGHSWAYYPGVHFVESRNASYTARPSTGHDCRKHYPSSSFYHRLPHVEKNVPFTGKQMGNLVAGNPVKANERIHSYSLPFDPCLDVAYNT